MAAKTIIVGEDPSSRYVAFGDDSLFRRTAVFAFAIFHRAHIASAEDTVAFFRRKYAFPDSCPIHCRVLFSGQQRKKHGLEHLAPQDVKDFLTRLLFHLNKLPVLCRFAWARIPETDPLFLATEEWPEIPNEPKALQSLLAQACFAVAADGSEGPRLEETELVVFGDRTKVRFMGPKRQQVERTYAGYNEIGTPDGIVLRGEPRIVQGSEWTKYPLLQLADVFAYVCAHAEDGTEGTEFFRGLMRSMVWSRATFVLDNEGERRSSR